jgi:FkbM family methyltransferase
LRANELNGRPLWVRPGATDPELLIWDYGYGQHRPPVEVAGHDMARIVELGCNVGAALASFASRYPHAEVLGVDADPDNVVMAKRNVAAFGDRCRVVEAAIWDEEAELVIDGAAEWSLAARPARPDESPAMSRVMATTVDTLLEAHMPEGTVDFMNVSLEGGEPRALGGTPSWPQRVGSLRVEVQPERGFELAEALTLVSGLGYSTRVEMVAETPFVFGLRSGGGS